MWDPVLYLRYGDQRSRPFLELIARIGAERPRSVVDLGCGPGTLTRTLADRWPDARISGLDSAPEMIDRATATTATATAMTTPAAAADRRHGEIPQAAVRRGEIRYARIRYAVGDVTAWRPAPDDDVVVCNAVLQWVPGHEALLTRWAGLLPAGAWLAVQVPGNFDAPSHRALRAVAADERWRDRTAQLSRTDPVRDAAGYAALLADAGCEVDAWETTYVHVLPVADPATHPVLSWLEGTALRPYHAALAGDGPAWSGFRAALAGRLAEAYPVRDGRVHFPFRRIFFVARTGRPG